MKALRQYGLTTIALLVTGIIFIVPFIFIILTAIKDRAQAARMDFSWPTIFPIWDNFWTVISTRDFMLITAYINSVILTVGSVTLLVVLAGLMMPPAVVPTIWLLQEIGMFATLHGMIFIEVAYNLSFCIILYRAFVATIPRELDEAAIIDGARPMDVFFRIILPLLRPVTVTVIVVQSVTIFNDFVNPLYYLPGNDNVTVQLTLYNFQSQFNTAYNLLFMNILLVTIPPLIVFLFFNRQIVAGMTSGAVKG